jgi:hypothetical protein
MKWKKIDWTLWKYKVSTEWNVLSMNYMNTWIQKELSVQINNWYVTTKISFNKKIKRMKVHRLVALTFIPNPENRPYVNHKNWNKKDNRVLNLEWTTAKENVNHADRTWLRKIFWWNNYHAKEILQYDKCWNYITEWPSMTTAAQALWICKTMISLVASWKRKTTWGYIFKYKYEYIKIERLVWTKLILS